MDKKKDGTDIDTYEKAYEIAVKWQKRLDSHINFRRGFFYKSCINLPKYDFNKLSEFENCKDFNTYIGDDDIQKLMRNQIENEYFKPLLGFLDKQSNKR